MNNNFVDIIKRITAEQGEAILGDPARLKGYVADYAKNESKAERLAFGRCIEYGAYTELKGAEDREAAKAAIARRVNTNEGIELALCNDALDALETALFGEAKPKKALCLKCGKELEPGWKACPFCGAEAESAAQAVVPQSATPLGAAQVAVPQSAAPADPAQAGAKKHTGRNVALVVMVAAVIAGGIYLFTKLTDNSSGGAGIIYVSGSDVYVAGVEKVDDGDRATYWKNGQPVRLSNSPSKAESIYVRGSDVYVAGSEGAFGEPRATYWKNGQPVRLSNSLSAARSIYVSGSDVYVAGSDDLKATYWKNGQPVRLSNSDSRAESIYVSGSDVYVAGDELVDGDFRAIYWKNGQPILPSNSFLTYVSSIYVSGSDVYVAGVENSRATYWKNDQKINLRGY
jgi:hypothetical protein